MGMLRLVVHRHICNQLYIDILGINVQDLLSNGTSWVGIEPEVGVRDVL